MGKIQEGDSTPMQKDDRLVPAWPTHDDSEQQGGTSREVVAMEEAEDQDDEEQGIVADALSDFIKSEIKNTISAKENSFAPARDMLYKMIIEAGKQSISEELRTRSYFGLIDYHSGNNKGTYTIVVDLKDIISEHLPVVIQTVCESLSKNERNIIGYNFIFDYGLSSDDNATSSINWEADHPKDKKSWIEQKEKYKRSAQSFFSWYRDLKRKEEIKSNTIKVTLILHITTFIAEEELQPN